MKDGKRFKAFVKRGYQSATSKASGAAVGAGRYVGGIAKRKITEGVESIFGEPINARERELYHRGYEAARLRFARQRGYNRGRESFGNPIFGQKKKDFRFI